MKAGRQEEGDDDCVARGGGADDVVDLGLLHVDERLLHCYARKEQAHVLDEVGDGGATVE